MLFARATVQRNIESGARAVGRLISRHDRRARRSTRVCVVVTALRAITPCLLFSRYYASYRFRYLLDVI